MKKEFWRPRWALPLPEGSRSVHCAAGNAAAVLAGPDHVTAIGYCGDHVAGSGLRSRRTRFPRTDLSVEYIRKACAWLDRGSRTKGRKWTGNTAGREKSFSSATRIPNQWLEYSGSRQQPAEECESQQRQRRAKATKPPEARSQSKGPEQSLIGITLW